MCPIREPLRHRAREREVNRTLSYPDYLDLRDRNRSFEDLAAFNNFFAGLDAGGGVSRAMAFEVTGNFFDVFRLQPYAGRFFRASDE